MGHTLNSVKNWMERGRESKFCHFEASFWDIAFKLVIKNPDKVKLKEFIITKPLLYEMLKGLT